MITTPYRDQITPLTATTVIQYDRRGNKSISQWPAVKDNISLEQFKKG